MTFKQYKSAIQSFFILFLLVILPCACATLSKDECLNGDWYGIGYRDGVTGCYPDYIAKHQKACSKFSIAPDYSTWEKGRQDGLKHYCTKSNAYRLGEQGLSFNSVCSGKMAGMLQGIHARGLAQHNRQKNIEKNEKKLEEYKEILTKLRNGEKLHLKTEKEARKYMLDVHEEILCIERQIDKSRTEIERIRRYDTEMLWEAN